MLTSCTFYQGLLGYPNQPRSSEFTLYNPRFTTDNAQLFTKPTMPFAGFYYRTVPGTSPSQQRYDYLKFREDGSFFTAFMPAPPEQFHLTTPVDDLGYIALAGDSARYELKSAINHAGFTGQFLFYGDSLCMVEQPTRRKARPNRLVYRRYLTK